VGDLDELPHSVLGYGLLEPPSRRATLAPRPLEPRWVRWHSPIGAVVFTSGCKFSCPYCPIPAYNQRQYRAKSPERITEELTRLHEQYGLHFIFGTDDNFFNDRERTVSIVETLARAEIGGQPLRHRVRWGTEVTVHDTLGMRDHLLTVRKAGVRAVWLGVEDITATLVKKGQTVDKTLEVFAMLRQYGILPIPMLMHHDGQPLVTRTSPYGLLNQVRMLRKAGAIDVQVLTITPAVGARDYEEAFRSGRMIRSAVGKSVDPYMLDGNYVVATGESRPWWMQLRVAAALAYFYNPLRLVESLIRPKANRYLVDAAVQTVGLLGLIHTLPRTLAWALRLMTGWINWESCPPAGSLRLTGVDRRPASHGYRIVSAAAAGSPA
jgi:radical SAM superfamily enzyme YgiQ (UPF0313 family)